jgi:hypothetical protein
MGNSHFFIGERDIVRTDFQLPNDRNQKIFCSLYAPFGLDFSNNTLPCVIYCHTNSG